MNNDLFIIKSGRLQAKSRTKRRIFNIFLFLISPKICLGEIFFGSSQQYITVDNSLILLYTVYIKEAGHEDYN